MNSFRKKRMGESKNKRGTTNVTHLQSQCASYGNRPKELKWTMGSPYRYILIGVIDPVIGNLRRMGGGGARRVRSVSFRAHGWARDACKKSYNRPRTFRANWSEMAVWYVVRTSKGTYRFGYK